MLYIMRYDDYPDMREAARIVGKPLLLWPDSYFCDDLRKLDVSYDPWFIKFLRDVDRCDIPLPNVARDLLTGMTHSFDKISTGVRTLWLMRYHASEWLFPSEYLGENCYQSMLDLSTEVDVIVYNSSNMLCSEIEGYSMDNCTGTFCDYKTRKQYTIVPGGDVCWNYSMEGL